MSGIVGIWNMDGEPIDRGLLGRMTGFMTFRGPDAQKIWIDSEIGSIGFGHTLLKTTFEAEFETQPFTLDGKVWIVADARVDAQDELIAQLNAKPGEIAYSNVDSLTDPKRLLVGQASSLRSGLSPAKSRPEGRLQPQKADPTVKKGSVTDVELILRAYHLWDEDCVEHLLGDFAFAIWDGPKKKLFCARDQMGVKPFFYAQIGRTVIFSSSLDCVRQHPKVSDELNDLAIADFLLFGLNQDLSTTSFADIGRIPPAHCFTWMDGRCSNRKYWTLPIDEPIYFKRADDYTDRFRELLDQAVSDRLRTNKIGVFLSGGLDSSTLAASAKELLQERHPDYQLHGFTSVLDGVVDNNEGYYAGLVAEKLGMPIHYRNTLEEDSDANWESSLFHTPEPHSYPRRIRGDRAFDRFAFEHARVLFFGEGPDNALDYEWEPYLKFLIQRRDFGRLVSEIAFHMLRHRRIPLIPTIPKMIRQRVAGPDWTPRYPAWLNSEFEARLDLEERWRRSLAEGSRHELRCKAYESFTGIRWVPLFEGFDAQNLGAPCEVRHPYIDLRLLRYLIALPALSWCRDKYIVRRAMRGRLPSAILRRPKSPLAADPTWAGERRLESCRPLEPAHLTFRYIDVGRVAPVIGEDTIVGRTNRRVRSLNYWLRSLTTESISTLEGHTYEQVATAIY